VAQSKLKDFQEGEMRLGKACRLRKGNLETKRVGPNQNVLPSISISTTGQRVMKANLLDGKKVAILVTDGFEHSELEEPRAALDEAKAATFVISPINDAVKAWNKVEFGDTVKVDVLLRYADSDDYDALLLPGGVMNPDRLRQLPEAVKFVRAFFEQGKPVAAICHGPQILIDADVVRGRRLTSYPSIKADLINAGARWVDEKVVVDRGLVTSRRPDDIPDFNKKMIEEFAEGVHAVQAA
jgi:protease I